jgi:hypothetical protein
MPKSTGHRTVTASFRSCEQRAASRYQPVIPAYPLSLLKLPISPPSSPLTFIDTLNLPFLSLQFGFLFSLTCYSLLYLLSKGSSGA